jgi:ubiquinone/menaquinone biosynthesis C-methylase UbiE
MRRLVNEKTVLELNRRYHDEVEAAVYDVRMGVTHHGLAFKEMIEELERVLGRPLPSGDVVVDVGAGTGHVAIKLALSGKFRKVVAADISEGMLAKTRTSAEAQGCVVETIRTDLTTLPFEDDTIDLIVGCAILHHLPDPNSLMREVMRVLKPGGSFVFIGEPSKYGALLIETLKLPLVAMNRAYRVLRRVPKTSWDHASIDVHTFSVADLNRLASGFAQPRILAESFLEGLLNQLLFSPLRVATGRISGAGRAIAAVRRFCRMVDERFLARIIPRDICMNVKFSGTKPARGLRG